MQTQILTTIRPEELKEMIESAVSRGISIAVSQIKETEKSPKYYTKAEAKQFLKIGMVTLCQRIKEGTIKVNRIGGRVLIAESELIRALESGSLRKRA